MKFLIMFPQYLTIASLIFYSFWLLLFEWLSRKDEGSRNKINASQLVLLEYQLVMLINTMREQMDKSPIDHKPVLDTFNDRGWEILRIRCRQMVLGAVRKLAWVKEV